MCMYVIECCIKKGITNEIHYHKDIPSTDYTSNRTLIPWHLHFSADYTLSLPRKPLRSYTIIPAQQQRHNNNNNIKTTTPNDY